MKGSVLDAKDTPQGVTIAGEFTPMLARPCPNAVAAACSSSRPLHAAASRGTGQPPRLPSSGSIRHERDCSTSPNLSAALFPSLIVRQRRRRSLDHTAPYLLLYRHRRAPTLVPSTGSEPRHSHRSTCQIAVTFAFPSLSKTDARSPQIPIARSVQNQAHLPAISCLGASPTPALGARGWPRHAGVRETCTTTEARKF